MFNMGQFPRFFLTDSEGARRLLNNTWDVAEGESRLEASA